MRASDKGYLTSLCMAKESWQQAVGNADAND